MTDLAITNDSTDIEVLPPSRPPVGTAIGQLMEHAQSMAAAKQLGDALADTDLVPKDYKGKPGNAAAAILYGAELGLNPIQSLQQIFVVHGSPAIYARTAVALLKRHGIVIQTVSSTNQAVAVRATDPRTGQVEESTWDYDRAKLAGYTTNKKYDTDPQAMLYAKAAMEVCRKIAPDVLLGIPYSREELDLESPPAKVASARGSGGVAGLRELAQQSRPAPAAAPAAAAPQAEASVSSEPLSKSARTKWEKAMFAALGEGGCTGQEDQLAAITELAELPEVPVHRNGITDEQLKKVVGTLGDWKKAGTLAQKLQAFVTPSGQSVEVPEPVVLASEEQLAKLRNLREAERYDDDPSWFSFLGGAVNRRVTATEDLTLDEAQAVIDIINEAAAQ